MNNDRLAILIKKAELDAEKVQAPFLQEYELSVAQYKFLKHLYNEPKDSVRIVDLEEDYSMSHAAVIDILKVLEKKGYTTRIVNPDDARSKLISLTEKAYALRLELSELSDQMEDAVSRNLTDKEREQLIFLLHKMMGH